MLLFRQIDTDDSSMSPGEMQAVFKKWDNWFTGIAAQGKLSNMGIRLASPGKVLKAGGVITDGPFVEIRERLNGFIVIRADDIEEATTLAHGCPILEIDGTVEIRPFLMSEQREPNLFTNKSGLSSS